MNLFKICVTILFVSQTATAVSPWLETFNHPQRQQQIDLRWHADGGEFAINFEDSLLKELGISVTGLPPQTKIIDTLEHALFQINNTTSLDIQAPFGVLESIPSGQLHIKSNFEWKTKNKTIVFNDVGLSN